MIELGLSEEEQSVARRVDDIARTVLVPIIHEFGERHEMCRDLLSAMAEHGLLGLNIDAEYGGAAGEHRYSTLLCILREHLGYHDPTVDFTFGLQGLGTVAIVRHGTDEQRHEFLGDLVAGRRIFAFALTEPSAGSDVRAMQTQAVPDGDDYVLTGTKTYISGAPDADVYVVVARTPGEGSRGFSAFVVRSGTVGFSARQDISLSAPHAIGTLEFDQCRIPSRDLVGAQGSGLHVAFGTLEVYRPSVGALAVGMGRRALDLSLAYARQRSVSGQRLIDLEAIRLKVARMWSDTYASRALVYAAAAQRDAGEASACLAAMAKLHATETAHHTIYEAQQIHGGRGVTVGFEVETLFRHIRQATIYEGTSEIQRTIIARSLRRDAVLDPTIPCDPRLHIASAAISAVQGCGAADELFQRHSIQFAFADVAVAMRRTQLLEHQATILADKDDVQFPRLHLAYEISLTDALDRCRALVRDLSRRGVTDADLEGAARQLDELGLASIDVMLLELAQSIVDDDAPETSG